MYEFPSKCWALIHWPLARLGPIAQVAGNDMKWAAQRAASSYGNRWKSRAFSRAVSAAFSMWSALKCRDLHINILTGHISQRALQPPCLAAENHKEEVRNWGNCSNWALFKDTEVFPHLGSSSAPRAAAEAHSADRSVHTLPMDPGKDPPSEESLIWLQALKERAFC